MSANAGTWMRIGRWRIGKFKTICGCLQIDLSIRTAATTRFSRELMKILTGNIYGRLTALSYSGTKELQNKVCGRACVSVVIDEGTQTTALVSGGQNLAGVFRRVGY